jgi:hypothetical protein
MSFVNLFNQMPYAYTIHAVYILLYKVASREKDHLPRTSLDALTWR